MFKEDLGEIIFSSFGQGAVILSEKEDPTICFVSNGTPATFYEFNLYSGTKLFEERLPDGDCVWAICKARDGSVYFCNTVDQLLYVYKNKSIEIVGKVPTNPFVFTMEQHDDYVWGGSYPNSKLFLYDIHNSEFTDYGTMFVGDDYIRALTFHEGYLYMGSGSTQNIKRLHIKSNILETLYLSDVSGQNGFLDNIFITGNYLIVSSNYTQLFIYDRYTLEKIDSFIFDNLIHTNHPFQKELLVYKEGRNLCAWNTVTKKSEVLVENKLPKGRLKAIEWIKNDSYYDLVLVTVNADVSIVSFKEDIIISNSSLAITPQPIILTVMEISKSGRLYAGGYHRGLGIYNIETKEIEGNVGLFPQTEGIAFHGDEVFFGTYTHAHLYRYKESTPLQFDWSASGNPTWLGSVENKQDRPFAVTSGDKYVFFGTVPDYGIQGGALAVWDTELEVLTTFPQVVENQSITGLVYKDGYVYGSTGVWGGLGKPPVAGPAKIFVWDVKKQQKVTEFVPKIPNFDADILIIGNLAVGIDGNIWGIIGGTIFCIDAQTFEVVKSKVIYPTSYAYSKWRPNCIRFGSDGLVYTNLGKRLTVVDPESLDSKQISDETIAHMTIDSENRIYYFNGPKLFRLTLDASVM